MLGYKPVSVIARPYSRLAAPPSNLAPPPAPDVLFAGYSGAPGFVETVTVLAVSASAAWIGIRTALGTDRNPYVKAAGWVGGVGAALIGLLYLGGKSGISETVGLPVVRVAPY